MEGENGRFPATKVHYPRREEKEKGQASKQARTKAGAANRKPNKRAKKTIRGSTKGKKKRRDTNEYERLFLVVASLFAFPCDLARLLSCLSIETTSTAPPSPPQKPATHSNGPRQVFMIQRRTHTHIPYPSKKERPTTATHTTPPPPTNLLLAQRRLHPRQNVGVLEDEAGL